MTIQEKMAIERLRLRKMNPEIKVFSHGWLKLVAAARVNVYRRAGIYAPVDEKVFQSHCIGSEAAIIIDGIVPNVPIDDDQRQLTLF